MELLVIAILLTVAGMHTGQSSTSTRRYALPATPPRPTTFPGMHNGQRITSTRRYALPATPPSTTAFPGMHNGQSITSTRRYALPATPPSTTTFPDSVRNVATWPPEYASPGEEITCIAEGNPKPSFKWQWKVKDEDGKWEDVPGETSKKIKAPLNNGTSYQLRCVAKNTVKKKEYSEKSPAVIVSKHGAAIRTAIIVVVVVVVVILVIIGCLAYKKKPASEGRVGQWLSL